MPDPIRLVVNGAPTALTVDPGTPLLAALRGDLGLTGSRFGCGEGLCGACTVLVDGTPVNACDTPVWSVVDREITTIEGLSADGTLHRVQQAFLDEGAVQCGYCSAGMVMAAVALLRAEADPDDAAVDRALERHLCRCGTYPRIRRAIHRAAGTDT